MTFLSAHHKPMAAQALQTIVIDLTTGEKIPRVVWANDETGRYRQKLVNQFGKLYVECVKGRKGYKFRAASKIFTGQIELRRK